MTHPDNFPSGLHRHQDGGIYRVVGRAISSDDRHPLVLYEHLWPGELGPHPWARRLEEWHSRFQPICEFEYRRTIRGDRQAAKAEVAAARARRKGVSANDAA